MSLGSAAVSKMVDESDDFPPCSLYHLAPPLSVVHAEVELGHHSLSPTKRIIFQSNQKLEQHLGGDPHLRVVAFISIK